MSYVPPHKRHVAKQVEKKSTDQLKKDHRMEFPILRNEEGQTMMPIISKTPVISWSGITFDEDDEITAAPIITLKDGWVKLSEYIPDTTMTTAQLLRCAENMEDNHRRYYWERGLEIPQWIIENPYDKFEDFDRTIPISNDNDDISESEYSSEGEDPLYESDSSN